SPFPFLPLLFVIFVFSSANFVCEFSDCTVSAVGPSGCLLESGVFANSFFDVRGVVRPFFFLKMFPTSLSNRPDDFFLGDFFFIDTSADRSSGPVMVVESFETSISGF
ncbi:hypothetical protein PMAYCL1PPCAC_23481, partial [Pristionchus mayeri]